MEVLTGRLTADAKVNTVKGDKQVVNFSIAINDRYKTKSGETKENTHFVNCAYWTGIGIAPYLTKGGLVELAGRVDFNVWNDMDGKAKGVLTLNVNNIKLHGKSKTQEGTTKRVEPLPAEETKDDLPF
jgi:single-strand DNA-binding protein